jgi:NADPH-dependent 2,4-dienoyl-CoA reductase/sulfur reductase-like enzyme
VLREVVVVGASLAGLRAVETLRTAGYTGRITVIGDEMHAPYDRPPLSKRLLAGDWEPERILLRKADDLASLDVSWRFGVAATRLDPAARTIALADGSSIAFDGAIIATGSRARTLAGQEAVPDVVVLRTLDDALALRARIAGGNRRVVVVGAGFIGLEVAATARRLGNEVLVLEAAPSPLMRGLGTQMGRAVAAVHADHGVEVRCGVVIEGLAPGAVLIDGGWHESADVIVVGVGVTPATDWLEGSGLTISDGIVCHPDLNVGSPLVYAAGDVVRWHNALFGEDMRVEHWTNAAEQGAAAASNLLAESLGQRTTPYAPVPFFWSEQYDRRIQFLGRAHPHHDVRVVHGSIEARQFVALYGDGERLRAVLGMNSPRQVMPFRDLLMEQTTWADGLEHAAKMEAHYK